MKKITILKLIIVILMAVIILSLIFISKTAFQLQQCPDAWIQNRMPGYDPRKMTQDYFVINGNRQEINKFDMNWIKRNCHLVPTKVY